MPNDERKCPHCQAVLEADAIFCVECGNTTNVAEAEEKTVIKLQANSPIITEIREPVVEYPTKIINNVSEPMPPLRMQTEDISVNNSVVVSALTTRYRDGYRVARTIDGFGKLLKILGIVFGAMILFFGLISGVGGAVALGPSKGGEVAFIVSLFLFGLIAAIVAVIFWVLGVIVSAQGQMLKASFDSAVNNSPFLENADRSKIMSLPNV
jgi:RNA polymerase subunit RPABC4/transcription elongation factor Spt4